MRKWFELGQKIGCIEVAKELCNAPSFFAVGPHDIESVHYEILDYMRDMGLDGSPLEDLRIEEYKKHVLAIIKPPNKETKRQLFLLGYNFVKLRMLLLNEIDDIYGESRTDLCNSIVEGIAWLGLPKGLKDIDIKTYRAQDFAKIETAICNNPRWSSKEGRGKQAVRFFHEHPLITGCISSFIAGLILLFSFWSKIVAFLEGLF